jgi:hypothetical protein
MSSRFPTIDEAIAFLIEHNQPGMAILVERMNSQLTESRSANQKTLAAYNAMKTKYEPMYRYPNYRSPPDSDG